MELEYNQGRIDRRLVQRKSSMIEPLLILEYRLIEELCLLEVAVGRPGACTSNTLLVCAIGLLLSSAAAAAAGVDLFVFQKYKLVPSTVFTSCCLYNKIRKRIRTRVIC